MAGLPPGAASSLPRNESELLHHRPPSHQDGVFPRRLLLDGERVLFETRPSLVYQHAWVVVVLAFFFLSSAVTALAGLYLSLTVSATAGSEAAALASFGAIGALFWGAILLLVLRSRRSSAFALTHRRVLSIRGFWSSDFRFASWEQIERMYMPAGGLGTIVFEVRPAATSSDSAGSGHRSITWNAISWGPRTYAFAQIAFAVEAARSATEARDRRQRAEILAQRVQCAYCGNLVVPELSGNARQSCPRCAAPLPIPDATAAPSTAGVTGATEATVVPFLRPVVFLGRQAIEWYRAVPILWGVLLVGLVGSFLLSGPGGTTSGPLGLIVVVTLVVAVPLSYILWAQSIRKWSTVIRTLRGSLPTGSPWRVQIARTLRQRLRVAIAGFLGGIVLPIVALAVEVEFNMFGPPVGAPPTAGELAFAVALMASVATIVIGQAALVTSFPKIAAGSGIPAIEAALRRGSTLAYASLLTGFWPLGVLLVAIGINAPVPSAGYWLLPGLVGPIGVSIGLYQVLRALDVWSAMAEHVVARSPGGAVGPDPDDVGPAEPYDDLAYTLAAPFRWRTRRARWTLTATLGIVAVALVIIVSNGWLAPVQSRLSLTAGDRTLSPPQLVIPAGSNWSLPAFHYESQYFPVHRNGTVVGAFNATGPVDGYVMDSNAFNVWLIGGYLRAEFSTGNVTQGTFHAPIVAPDRYYVVLVNWNQTQAVEVSWTADCELTFVG